MDLEAFFHEYKEKKNAYQMALSTMYYDQATIAPKNGIPYRNRMTCREKPSIKWRTRKVSKGSKSWQGRRM